jgi:coenzyme F420-0:L-glutamate ligase / coenzyme F420-1:gamma-L-glutamate ligase
MKSAILSVIPVPLAEDIAPGDDLVRKLRQAMQHHNQPLLTDDVLVIKHKIVSKAEGRIVALDSVQPSQAAKAWAKKSGADARVVELAMSEAKRVVRKKVVNGRGILITETHHGFVCANSGVDISNVDGGQRAILLPKDPDRSASRIRKRIQKEFGASVAVIISDSFGRPWREGLTEVAIGVAGMSPLHDDRGKRDPHGYVLHASAEAVADELACAAGLVCGKLNRTPFCIVRGFRYSHASGRARDLIRDKSADLFR